MAGFAGSWAGFISDREWAYRLMDDPSWRADRPGPVSDEELAHRLADEIKLRGWSMSNAAATSQVNEWAPGRAASILTLGASERGTSPGAMGLWYSRGSDLVAVKGWR